MVLLCYNCMNIYVDLKDFSYVFIISTSSTVKDKFPKINDIFLTLSEHTQVSEAEKPPDVLIKNISINLDTINMSKFGEKLTALARTFSGNITDENNVLLKEFNKTRRLAWIGTNAQWMNASKVAVKNKIFDLMLQTIYMARHKIKQVETEAYYNPADTSYRIAFLYRRLRRIWKRMLDIYSTMEHKRQSKKSNRRHDEVGPFLVLHHKAAKLHVDFLYLWWVLIRLHERYDYRHGIPNTPPGMDMDGLMELLS